MSKYLRALNVNQYTPSMPVYCVHNGFGKKSAINELISRNEYLPPPFKPSLINKHT
jgi:hypothetical protein